MKSDRLIDRNRPLFDAIESPFLILDLFCLLVGHIFAHINLREAPPKLAQKAFGHCP